jgi:rubredoxin
MTTTCPVCSTSENVREILYGMPAEEPDRSIHITGGCLVETDQPTHRCLMCGWELAPTVDKYKNDGILRKGFFENE